MSDVSTNGSFEFVQTILNDNNPKIIPYIRSSNVGDTFINNCELEKISLQAHQKLQKSATKLYDVIMARKGKIGGASIITEDEIGYNCNENVIKLTLKDNRFNPFYLTVFYNSKYGLKQIERISTGNVQPWVSIFQIRKLKTPLLNQLVQEACEFFLKDAHHKLNEAKQKYAQAETLLLETLGLQNFQPANNPVSIKTLSGSLKTSGRLDAEFYQEKYDLLEIHLSKFPQIKLANLVDYPISSGVTPKAGGDSYTDENMGIPFIRAVDLDNGRVDLNQINYIKPSIHDTVLRHTKLKKNDVLISIAGTVGRSALFTYDIEANINQAVAIIRFSEINLLKEYLVIYLNSEIGKFYISKYARQGLQTNLNLAEVGELSIPIIPMTIQTKIADLIRQSNELRVQAQNLLAQAKQMVETEIETRQS